MNIVDLPITKMLIFHTAMCVSLPEAINFLGIYQECHFEPFNRSHPQPPSPKKTHRCGTRGWWCTSYELGGWDCDHILWLVVTGTWILSITYISIESIAGWWFGTMEFYDFPVSWECYHPNWLSLHHFSEGWRKTTNQCLGYPAIARLSQRHLLLFGIFRAPQCSPPPWVLKEEWNERRGDTVW